MRRDLEAVSHAALPNEQRTIAALGDAIGHVDKFVKIPPMIVAAVANGLSLAGAGTHPETALQNHVLDISNSGSIRALSRPAFT